MSVRHYQRLYCTTLCPRLHAPNSDCSLCRVLDEGDRFLSKYWSKPWWCLWHYSGIREICAIIEPNCKAATDPKASTFLLWAAGIYAALFGIATQYYENYIDRIEARANGIYAQLGASNAKRALARIPDAQAMTRPKRPELLNPWSVACSLYFCEHERDSEMVETLKEVIVTFKADLRGANLHKADLRGADLSKADLKGVNLSKADLRQTNLQGANLRLANLSRARLNRAKLGNADLRQADLHGAILNRAELNGADLCLADLSWARPVEARLGGADLRQVKLNGANLRGADLRKADLHGANLSQAKLSGADLRGANLNDIRWNDQTIWPDGFVPSPSR